MTIGLTLFLLAIAVYYAVVIAFLEWCFSPIRRYERQWADALEAFKADGDWEHLAAVLRHDPRRRARRARRGWRIVLPFAIALDLTVGLVVVIGQREDWW